MSDKPLVTPVFRGSFVHLIEPKAPAPEAEPVYSMAIVLPKDDPDTKKFMSALKERVTEAAKDKLGKVPRKLKAPWKDGDEEERPEWEGCWVVNAKSKVRPGTVDSSLNPIMEPDKLYSGAYFRASVSPWAWSHKVGGQGVSLNLHNVMFVKDGEAFAGGTKAEDDFAGFAEAPAEEEEDEEGEVEFD
jgi:hypothetical protein